MTGSSIFSVLGPGLGSLGGWCPQWLLRGASPASLEEPTPPQTLAAAQKVAGARGAGQRRLPEETQAQVRAAGIAEQGPGSQGLASGLCFFYTRPQEGWGGKAARPPCTTVTSSLSPQGEHSRHLLSNPKSASNMPCALGQVT